MGIIWFILGVLLAVLIYGIDTEIKLRKERKEENEKCSKHSE